MNFARYAIMDYIKLGTTGLDVSRLCIGKRGMPPERAGTESEY